MDFPLPEWPCSTTHSPLFTFKEAFCSPADARRFAGGAQRSYLRFSTWIILASWRFLAGWRFATGLQGTAFVLPGGALNSAARMTQQLGVRMEPDRQHAVGKPTFHHLTLLHYQQTVCQQAGDADHGDNHHRRSSAPPPDRAAGRAGAPCTERQPRWGSSINTSFGWVTGCRRSAGAAACRRRRWWANRRCARRGSPTSVSQRCAVSRMLP